MWAQGIGERLKLIIWGWGWADVVWGLNMDIGAQCNATSLPKSVGPSPGRWGCRERSRNPEGKLGQAENVGLFLKSSRYKNIRFIRILENWIGMEINISLYTSADWLFGKKLSLAYWDVWLWAGCNILFQLETLQVGCKFWIFIFQDELE